MTQWIWQLEYLAQSIALHGYASKNSYALISQDILCGKFDEFWVQTKKEEKAATCNWLIWLDYHVLCRWVDCSSCPIRVMLVMDRTSTVLSSPRNYERNLKIVNWRAFERRHCVCPKDYCKTDQLYGVRRALETFDVEPNVSSCEMHSVFLVQSCCAMVPAIISRVTITVHFLTVIILTNCTYAGWLYYRAETPYVK